MQFSKDRWDNWPAFEGTELVCCQDLIDLCLMTCVNYLTIYLHFIQIRILEYLMDADGWERCSTEIDKVFKLSMYLKKDKYVIKKKLGQS